MNKIIIACMAAALFASATLRAQITDNNWSSLGNGMQPFNSIVNSLATESGGTFFAGGTFTTAGAQTCENIARLNGSDWNALAGGGSVGGTVNALAPDGAGGVYIGGTFTTAGGTSCNNIIHYDGTFFSALGSGTYGPDGTVYAIIPDGAGGIYVGGRFTTADGSVVCNNIAHWDGTTWLGVGLGITSNSGDATVFALKRVGSYLYAGGNFTTADWVACDNIARWDGTIWNTLSGLGGMNGPVYALETDGSNLYAGGSFTTAGGSGCERIALWNGTDWSPLGAGVTGGGVTALAYHSAGNMLYAGGSFTTAGSSLVSCIARWTGSDWEALGSGTDNSIHCLLVDESTAALFVGGRFTVAGGHGANYIARCDIGNNHTVTFVAGTGGSITGTTTQVVADGGSCSEVTAVPDSGYYLDGWTGTAGFASTSNPLTVTNVLYDMTITANFLQGTTHTVNFVAGTGGTIIGTTQQTIPHGGNCTEITALPDPGYSFQIWQSDLGQTSVSNPITVTNVVADQTWTASFTGGGGTTNIFAGAVISIPSSSVGISGDFTRKPGSRGSWNNPLNPSQVKYTNMTPVNTFPSANATVKWGTSIKLYNKGLVTNPKSTWILSNLPADLGLTTVEVKSSQTMPPRTWVIAAGVSALYRNPTITSISGVPAAGNSVIVRGRYYGEKFPKVLLEYQTANGAWKYKTCRRQSQYIYRNAKNQPNKSCTKILATDPTAGEVGESMIMVEYPSLPAGATASGYLIIDNGSGLYCSNIWIP